MPERAPQTLSQAVAITLDVEKTTEQLLFALKRVLADHPGSCPVRLLFHRADRTRALDVGSDLRVLPDSSFLTEIAGLVGERQIHMQASAAAAGR